MQGGGIGVDGLGACFGKGGEQDGAEFWLGNDEGGVEDGGGEVLGLDQVVEEGLCGAVGVLVLDEPEEEGLRLVHSGAAMRVRGEMGIGVT